MAEPRNRDGGGLNEAALAERNEEDLGGAGGSSGSGTRAGSGQPSGGVLDGTGGAIAGEMAAGDDREAALEAAALGGAAGAMAEAAGAGVAGAATIGAPPNGAEAIGGGPGHGDVGSATPDDKGDLGSGGSGRTARPGGGA